MKNIELEGPAILMRHQMELMVSEGSYLLRQLIWRWLRLVMEYSKFRCGIIRNGWNALASLGHWVDDLCGVECRASPGLESRAQTESLALRSIACDTVSSWQTPRGLRQPSRGFAVPGTACLLPVSLPPRTQHPIVAFLERADNSWGTSETDLLRWYYGSNYKSRRAWKGRGGSQGSKTGL